MKQMIWIGMLVGSTIGGFIPALWGDSFLSFSSIIFSALGAMAGIYIVYKLTH
ncbi:MAG TPA: hypothetical protein VN086_01365 [Candidatus Paceibacterota bacterium]|nr:hypothetical protein [Candidatus Paceibacterota bacterium]